MTAPGINSYDYGSGYGDGSGDGDGSGTGYGYGDGYGSGCQVFSRESDNDGFEGIC